MRLAAGLRPDMPGELQRSPGPLYVVSREGRDGRWRKGLGIGRGRNGRKWEDVDGWEGLKGEARDGKGRG